MIKLGKSKVSAFRAERKEAGRRIDPRNAEVGFWDVEEVDPYGILESIPPCCSCTIEGQFARSPDSNGWVFFEDLPDATREELSYMVERFETQLKIVNIVRSGDLTPDERELYILTFETLLKELYATQRGLDPLKQLLN